VPNVTIWRNGYCRNSEELLKIFAGNDSKIVQVYVEVPLIWGIHVAANWL
jgi:hypothetical protein